MPEITLIFLIIINIILITLPLTNILGYEFSLVNALILFFIGGLLIIWHNKKFNNVKTNFLNQLYSFKKYLLLFSIIPFIIGFISSLLFSVCPIKEGFYFYIIIPLPSLFFGIVVGRFIITLFNRFHYFVYVLTFLLILSVPIIEFYFNPQIYFYNPIFGFISGTIYDEDISISNILISYRLFNIAFFVGLAYLSELMNERKFDKWKSLLIVLISLMVFYMFKPTLHFSTSFDSLTKKLGKSLITEHTIIYFSKEIKNPKQIELIGLLHEYYYEKVLEELKLHNKPKLISFVFKDENQKRILFGSGKADVAKPWLNQIYLNYSTYKLTLKHEMVHSLASEFGSTPLKVAGNLNLAIIEGLAMAVENNFDNYPIDYMAKIAFESGFKFPIEKLFSGINFFSQYSSISYIYAGSFIRFLIERFGIDRVKEFYNSANFEKAFGITFNQIEKEYYDYLILLSAQLNRNKAQLYFGGKPIFKKYCPRLAASETKVAWKYYNKKKFYEAEKLFERIYGYSNSYESLLGSVYCKIKLNKIFLAELLLTKEIIKFKQSAYLYNLELILSDLFIRNNKLKEAAALYDSLLNQNSHIEFSNQVLIRKKILENGIDSLTTYLNLESKDKIKTLLELNKKEIQYFTIPYIINLCADDIKKLKKIVEFFNDRIEVKDYLSSYAAMKLSLAAVDIGDFELAKAIAIKSLIFSNDNFFNEILKENLKLINWLNNFSDDARTHFRHQ